MFVNRGLSKLGYNSNDWFNPIMKETLSNNI